MSQNPLFKDEMFGHSFITPDGVFSQEQLLVAQILSDYDPTLSLVRVENPDKEHGQLDCAVLCAPHVGDPYVVFYINQADINYNVIARIYSLDMQRLGRPLEDQLKANEMARELFEAARREEIEAEAAEFAVSVLKSPLHTYKHDGKVYR